MSSDKPALGPSGPILEDVPRSEGPRVLESQQVIQVQVRSVYGRDLIYPMSALAKVAVSLTGRNTFKSSDLKSLESMGFRVEWVIPKV